MRPLRLVRIDDVLLEVIREFNPSNFITDNSNQMNKHLIGAWVAPHDRDWETIHHLSSLTKKVSSS